MLLTAFMSLTVLMFALLITNIMFRYVVPIDKPTVLQVGQIACLTYYNQFLVGIITEIDENGVQLSIKECSMTNKVVDTTLWVDAEIVMPADYVSLFEYNKYVYKIAQYK